MPRYVEMPIMQKKKDHAKGEEKVEIPPMPVKISYASNFRRTSAIFFAVCSSRKESSGFAWKCLSKCLIVSRHVADVNGFLSTFISHLQSSSYGPNSGLCALMVSVIDVIMSLIRRLQVGKIQ